MTMGTSDVDFWLLTLTLAPSVKAANAAKATIVTELRIRISCQADVVQGRKYFWLRFAPAS